MMMQRLSKAVSGGLLLAASAALFGSTSLAWAQEATLVMSPGMQTQVSTR